MKLFGIFCVILWISLLGFCHAKVEDYLKEIEFNRTFNPLEGKVIDVRIAMIEKDYKEMVESSQMSVQEYNAVYHGIITDEMKYTTKVSVNITVDDQVYSYEKVKFKVGGNNARIYGKLGYNLNLNKKDRFFGRKNLRIRPDYFDVTHMRAKLVVDLLNKWNIPTIQETYANVYINDKFFGFYMFFDDIKPSWVHDVYEIPEEEDVKTLYSCGKYSFRFDPEAVRIMCQNEKEEYLNYTQPLYDMVDEIYNYTTLEQLQSKFDNVETIRKMFVAEYLVGAIDNYIMTGCNYNFYQKSNGMWDYIPMDFNLVFLVNFKRMNMALSYPIPEQESLIDYAKVKFDDWNAPGVRKPFIDILYYQDQEGFVKALKELLITGFNPDELFPRIDELFEFIKPYIIKDITPDKDGNYPGKINNKGIFVKYDIEESEKNANFDDDSEGNIGLKKFIQTKFDAVCELYGLDKDEILSEAKKYRQKRENEINGTPSTQNIGDLITELIELIRSGLLEIMNAIANLLKI